MPRSSMSRRFVRCPGAAAIPVVLAGFMVFHHAERVHAQAKTDVTLDAIAVQFAAAVNAKDPAKVAAFYTEDAVMMAPNEPMIRGRAQIEARYRSEFEAGITGLILRPMESIANATVAFEAGTSTVGLQSRNGTELASGKYVVIYKKVGDAWKIAYDIYTSD